MATASGSTAYTFSMLKVGKAGDGSVRGISPNRDVIVATSSGSTAQTMAAAITAIRKAGQ